jgi:hypothetical protein
VKTQKVPSPIIPAIPQYPADHWHEEEEVAREVALALVLTIYMSSLSLSLSLSSPTHPPTHVHTHTHVIYTSKHSLTHPHSSTAYTNDVLIGLFRAQDSACQKRPSIV